MRRSIGHEDKWHLDYDAFTGRIRKEKSKIIRQLSINVFAIIYAILAIMKAITTILTLGFYVPNWDVEFAVWKLRREIKRGER